MIIYSIKKLENDLQARTLSQKHVFIYFIVRVVLIGLGSLNFSGDELIDPWMTNLAVLLELMITVGFTLHLFNLCKEANQAERFWEYYFSIGFVIGVRLLVIGLILIIPVSVFILLLIPDFMNDFGYIFELGFTAIVLFVYYLMFINSLNRVLEDTPVD
ncbi:hypothetical protein AWW67_01545 [Roseivirga seohaensis]|uniref:Uncharacterized protein n=1 Tax=Roseivirga seohaensis TaxID=1914963 RepID=A0A150Y1F3_9BACT|nr:hypothetical protein [Roseivirga seohaensis]KYG84756.1 hypothetical protein AWW67_01545 [Roseivirga seohaensis]